jgi:hypothetical protein
MYNFSLKVFFKAVFEFFLVGIKEEHGSRPGLLVYLMRQCLCPQALPTSILKLHYTLH